MNQAIITLPEVLKHIDSGETFSEITFVTADKRRGTGGQIKTIYAGQKAQMTNLPANILRLNGIRETDRQNPNHYDNKTRNIYHPATRRITKVHIRLITGFEGKTVLL